MNDYISRVAAITAIGKPKVTPGGVIFDALKKACQEEVQNLPAADVVELPCRIGDTVWCIRSFRGIDHPQETKVSGMYFTQDMRLNIQCKYVGIGEFGKKVFKTREDAMKAMEGQRA